MNQFVIGKTTTQSYCGSLYVCAEPSKLDAMRFLGDREW
jgi:hypothetical protein